jgi:nucleotide-binding universal stress UspA family protein
MMSLRDHAQGDSAESRPPVAVKVLSDSQCYVWALGERAESGAIRPTQAAVGEIRSLLCAIDLGPESRALIRAADSLGARTGAKVRLTHAVAGDESAPRTARELELEKDLKDRARVSVARLRQEAGTAFDLCLRAGPPSRVVETVARHHEADLVIIGRGASQFSIIRECPCPVLSI